MKNQRYAAKILFQFLAVKNGVSNKRRVCEERIIVLEARNGKEALSKAKKRAKRSESSYKDQGIDILFEFIGVMELIELDNLSEEDEVWSIFTERVNPMERKERIIPPENKLKALESEGSCRTKRLTVPPIGMQRKTGWRR